MAYFPLFISLEGLSCLVIGGGKVALRKVRVLQEYGANVTVVSPKICPEIEEIPGLTLKRRRFAEGDLEEMKIVFAASSDEECNRKAAGLCRERRIPINVADMAEECDFFFPALVKRGEVVVGVSTGGTSPAVAACVRRQVEEALPEDLGGFTEEMGKRRAKIREKGGSPEEKRQYLKEIEDYFDGRGKA